MQSHTLIPPYLLLSKSNTNTWNMRAVLLLNSRDDVQTFLRERLHKSYSVASESDSHLSPATSECEGLKCAGSHLQRHIHELHLLEQ